jgi:hypothetical protein
MVSQARRRRYWTMVLRHPDIDGGRGDSRRQYSAVFGERFKTVASICFGGPNRGVWAFPAIGRPTRTSDHGSDAQEPASVVADCSVIRRPSLTSSRTP